eukprot:2385898-Pyramimonas_sp.AAC.1
MAPRRPRRPLRKPKRGLRRGTQTEISSLHPKMAPRDRQHVPTSPKSRKWIPERPKHGPKNASTRPPRILPKRPREASMGPL